MSGVSPKAWPLDLALVWSHGWDKTVADGGEVCSTIVLTNNQLSPETFHGLCVTPAKSFNPLKTNTLNQEYRWHIYAGASQNRQWSEKNYHAPEFDEYRAVTMQLFIKTEAFLLYYNTDNKLCFDWQPIQIVSPTLSRVVPGHIIKYSCGTNTCQPRHKKQSTFIRCGHIFHECKWSVIVFVRKDILRSTDGCIHAATSQWQHLANGAQISSWRREGERGRNWFKTVINAGVSAAINSCFTRQVFLFYGRLIIRERIASQHREI